MSIVPVQWSFKQRSFFPVIEVIGESIDISSEKILLKDAVEIIEFASKFKGSPCNMDDNYRGKTKISAYFSLVFPSDSNFEDFLKGLERGDMFRKN